MIQKERERKKKLPIAPGMLLPNGQSIVNPDVEGILGEIENDITKEHKAEEARKTQEIKKQKDLADKRAAHEALRNEQIERERKSCAC